LTGTIKREDVAIERGSRRHIDTALAIWTEAVSAARGLPQSTINLDRIRRRLTLPTTLMFLARCRDELIGVTMLAQACADGGAGSPIQGLAHISTVAVRPKYWGNGIAAMLMRAALTEALAQGYTRVQLWAHPTNSRADRLYRSLGFIETGDQQLDDFGEPMRRYALLI